MNAPNKVVVHLIPLSEFEQEEKNRNGQMVMPAMMFPSFRSLIAHKSGVGNRILFRSYGGMGDEICSEPVVRYAVNHFKDARISIATTRPWIFSHLKFDEVHVLKEGEIDEINYPDYLTLETYADSQDLCWHFLNHNTMHCVDFASILAYRANLPVAEKQIQLRGIHPVGIPQRQVIVHPGRSWATKTFPKEWWDGILTELTLRKIEPILIGAEASHGATGTVAVNPNGCRDLRGQLTPEETTGLLQRASVLITNDSGPLHMAASGTAWVALLATAKHPDLVMHWRNGIFGHKMQNFSRGGIWSTHDYCRNTRDPVNYDQADPAEIAGWLPPPAAVSSWAAGRHHEWLL